jgi:hypothetical protein
MLESNHYHPQLINELCKKLKLHDHFLNPILEHLVSKNVITDVALRAFLVPDRQLLEMSSLSQIKSSTLKMIGYNCINLVIYNITT